MSKAWFSGTMFVAGIGLILLGALMGHAVTVHVPTTIRLALVLLGFALMLYALESMNVFSVREHWAARGHVYRRMLSYVIFLFLGLLVLTGYVFFVSLGKWTSWAPAGDYYDRLSRALAKGHLYLDEAPAPSLLALPDPYDPEGRAGIPGIVPHTPGSLWDMSVYDGKAYPYWGPAPALLLLPIKLVSHVVVGDQVLTFAFLFGAFVLESLLLIRLWRRFFDDLPGWTVMAAMLLAGLVNPVPWLLFSPRIYEAAISAGQFFFLGGLFAAFSAVDRPVVSRRGLALAAVLWAAAVASRATVAISVAFLAVVVVVFLLARGGDSASIRDRLGQVAAFGLPLLAGALLIAWYNQARFGSIFEFGFRYAITMFNQNRYRSILFSPLYLAENASLYLFGRPQLDNLFPFVKPVWSQASIMAFNQRTGGIYNAERIVGVVYAAPFLLFSLIAPVLGWGRSRPRPSTEAGTAPGDPEIDSARFVRGIVLVLSVLAVIEMLVVFLVYYATMRYFLDVVPTLVTLASLGFWLGLQRLKGRRFWQSGFALLGLALVLASIVLGVLIGFSSDMPRLKAVNPWLLAHLRLLFISLARRIGG